MPLSKDEVSAVLQVIDDWCNGFSAAHLPSPPAKVLVSLARARAILMNELVLLQEREDEQV